MGLTITFGFYVEREREIDAFVELWRRLGARVAHAREHRAGKEIELVTSAPTREQIATFKRLSMSVEQVATTAFDEDWLRKMLQSLASSDRNLHLEMDCTVGDFDGYITLHCWGASFSAGQVRKEAGPMEASFSDYYLRRQKTPCRSGSDDVLYRALELFRLLLAWGTERPVVSHAMLYPEAGWTLFNGRAIYLASIRQLPSLYLWLYLNGRCGLAIPQAIAMLDGGQRTPKTRSVDATTIRIARFLPDGKRLIRFLEQYDVARASALAEASPDAVWDALRAAANGDPSWQLERSSDEILIANDADACLWELVVASAETLE
jgi:hypothetical protein